MVFGFAGSDLEVDLTHGNIEKEEGDPDLYRTYLGGRGIATKMFWDRVPPEVEAFQEENQLIFAAGALDGTFAPGANRTMVITKSPLTGLLTYSVLVPTLMALSIL